MSTATLDPVHFTTLKHIARSPAHYRAALLAKKDTPAMKLGRLVHTVVLGGPPSAVWDGERRGKAWLEFKAAHEGREIVTVGEVERATEIANAVGADPVARRYLAGQTERAVEWSMFGRRCATHGIDILGDRSEDFIADLKTSTTTEPRTFARQCLRLGYHSQLATYLEAAASIGEPRRRAIIVGVEVTAPFAVTVFEVGPAALEEGRKLHRLWMERLIACEAADAWPAYAQDVLSLDDYLVSDPEIIIDGDDVEVAA